MKTFLWNLTLTMAMLLIFSCVMFTVTASPLGVAVVLGTATWKQIGFFFAVITAPALIATELLFSRNRPNDRS